MQADLLNIFDKKVIEYNKLHVCGNDILVTFWRPDIDWTNVAKKICQRHFGIGADQLVVIIDINVEADIQIYNPDGSIAPLCVNAILALGHFLYCKNHSDININVISSNSTFHLISTDFNSSLAIESSKIRVSPRKLVDLSLAEFIVDNGTNHYVVLLNNFSDLNIVEVGSLLEKIAIPNTSTNVMFVRFHQDSIFATPWERGGTGITNACGSGAFSIARALTLYSNLEKTTFPFDNKITFPGGTIYVEIKDEKGKISASPIFIGCGVFFYEH